MSALRNPHQASDITDITHALQTIKKVMEDYPITPAEADMLKAACESNVDATEESQPQQEVKKEPPIKPAGDDDSGEKYFFGLNQEEAIQLFQSRWGTETFDFSGARLELPFGHVKTRYALVDYARCHTTRNRTLITLILAQARKLAKHYHFDIEPEIIHEAAKIVILNALNPTFTHVVRFTGRNGNILDHEVQIMLTKLEADAVLSTVGAFMDKHPLTDAENELLRITRMAEIGRQKPACESNGKAGVKQEPAGDDDSSNDTDPLDNNAGDVTESDEDQFNACMTDDCPNGAGDSQLCHDCREDAKVAHAESYTKIGKQVDDMKKSLTNGEDYLGHDAVWWANELKGVFAESLIVEVTGVGAGESVPKESYDESQRQ